jgi:hypothetical protein
MEPNPIKQPVRVIYQEQTYIVKYRHDQTPSEIEGKFSIRPISGTTTAYLGDYDNPISNITATAFCSAKDPFNKKTGRIVSTVRLIKKLDSHEHNII